MSIPLRRCGFAGVVAAAAALATCTEPPPAPVVASIELSVPDFGTAMLFREPIVVRATPLAALGVPVTQPMTVTWQSESPSRLSVVAISASGDSARISATGVGTGQIVASSGGKSKSFQVTVQDTAYSITVFPSLVSLTVGDTVTFGAFVLGPTAASRAARWFVADTSIARIIATPDSTSALVQARAAGQVQLRATAVADSLKQATATTLNSLGSLAFLTQPPASTQRGLPFSQTVVVEMRHPSGFTARNAAGEVSLALAAGACAGAALAGEVSRNLSNGFVVFPGISVTRRCANLSLVASADPPATAVNSQSFAIVPRGCPPVPMSTTVEVTAFIEDVDCAVVRSGSTYYVHSYSITIPPGAARSIRITSAGLGFPSQLEAHLWQGDTAAYIASSETAGPAIRDFLLPTGTYRFVVTSAQPSAVGEYILTPRLFEFVSAQDPLAPSVCVLTTVPAISTFTGPTCAMPPVTKSSFTGKRFQFYLAPNQSATARAALTGGTFADGYLELFDITSGAPVLLTSDDDSGGGLIGKDALINIAPSPNGRFLELRGGTLNQLGGVLISISL